MKNNLQKSNRKNAGFTLLELVVVVAVMGLISSMAMDVYTDNSNQKRFEATKERLAEIKFAIIGDPMMRVGSQAVLSGYYNDMNRLPITLSELIYRCRTTTTNIGIYAADKAECETTTDNFWETNWNGPYLTNIQSSESELVFRDAWGNTSSDGRFGWVFVTKSTDKTILVQSLGLDHNSTATTNSYEINYPSFGNLINKVDLDRIDHLKSLTTTSGYCINTSVSTTYTIDSTYSDLASCNAETDRDWAAFP
jgi:prepilin-type N-terminal cleavage/methylation domain-containing protein